MKLLIALALLIFCQRASAQFWIHKAAEDAAAQAVVVDQQKQVAIKNLTDLTVFKIEQLGELGEINEKLVPDFVLAARKAAMIAENEKDFVERFNALAETRAKYLGLNASPVTFPVQGRIGREGRVVDYSTRFTSKRVIPPDVLSVIKRESYEKWPSNADMREYRITQQSADWCRYQNFSQNADPVIQYLLKEAEKKWPADFGMLVFHIDERYKEYREGKEYGLESKLIFSQPERPAATERPQATAVQYEKDLPAGMMRRK